MDYIWNSWEAINLWQRYLHDFITIINSLFNDRGIFQMARNNVMREHKQAQMNVKISSVAFGKNFWAYQTKEHTAKTSMQPSNCAMASTILCSVYFPGCWADLDAPWIGLCRSFRETSLIFVLWVQILQWLGNFLFNSLCPQAKSVCTCIAVSLSLPLSLDLSVSRSLLQKNSPCPLPLCAHIQLIKQSTRFD